MYIDTVPIYTNDDWTPMAHMHLLLLLWHIMYYLLSEYIDIMTHDNFLIPVGSVCDTTYRQVFDHVLVP